MQSATSTVNVDIVKSSIATVESINISVSRE